jgi:hypothetical protein
MLYGKGKWTLICYAGSASEASIDSRPLGSELGVKEDMRGRKSQVPHQFGGRRNLLNPSCDCRQP